MVLRLGIDLDGCLADFNRAFILRLIKETGINHFPVDGSLTLDVWDYPRKYGYTHDQVSATWASIKADSSFWSSLPEYPTTGHDLYCLVQRMEKGDDVYFVTARVGATAKAQTEQWLEHRMGFTPTVLISSDKGLVAKALGLDAYIDDRWSNATEVLEEAP